MDNIDIIIWLKDGKTMRFEQVRQFSDDSNEWIGFVYHGVSTDKDRVAVFRLANIAGYAIDPQGIESFTDEEKELFRGMGHA